MSEESNKVLLEFLEKLDDKKLVGELEQVWDQFNWRSDEFQEILDAGDPEAEAASLGIYEEGEPWKTFLFNESMLSAAKADLKVFDLFEKYVVGQFEQPYFIAASELEDIFWYVVSKRHIGDFRELYKLFKAEVLHRLGEREITSFPILQVRKVPPLNLMNGDDQPKTMI